MVVLMLILTFAVPTPKPQTPPIYVPACFPGFPKSSPKCAGQAQPDRPRLGNLARRK